MGDLSIHRIADRPFSLERFWRCIVGVVRGFLLDIRSSPRPAPLPQKEEDNIILIIPPPKNIEPPRVTETYKVPITFTLGGKYATYNITGHVVVGKYRNSELNTSTVLDWLNLNKDNVDFCDALAICMIIADEFDYDRGRFLRVDYRAMFIQMDAGYNRLVPKLKF